MRCTTERQQEILTKARQDGRVEVRELAERLDVTPETVRRDLTALERLGLLHRVHGGAIPVERLGFEPAVAERETRHGRAEGAHRAGRARRAARRWRDPARRGHHDRRLAELLPNDRELTVVTHGLPIALALAGGPHITVHVLGGTLRPRTLAAVGRGPSATSATCSPTSRSSASTA